MKIMIKVSNILLVVYYWVWARSHSCVYAFPSTSSSIQTFHENEDLSQIGLRWDCNLLATCWSWIVWREYLCYFVLFISLPIWISWILHQSFLSLSVCFISKPISFATYAPISAPLMNQLAFEVLFYFNQIFPSFKFLFLSIHAFHLWQDDAQITISSSQFPYKHDQFYQILLIFQHQTLHILFCSFPFRNNNKSSKKK